ncbi:hypothetical protein BAE44_0014139 [Dichanthelium oligosanthes]|uniref:Uncharacterized protein n=1 Tax=Dichanthelium oligosanthes TaxID=888268 RepID=A0A1E5VI90_9POAL|nr:hypothetical protein BAE44_0014139 [Dichanthelium oligosanthes]
MATIPPFRSMSSIYLSFPLVLSTYKPGQCEPVLCRLVYMGMVSRKVPGAAGCSHLSWLLGKLV